MKRHRLHAFLQEKRNQMIVYLLRHGASREDAEDIVQDSMLKGFLYLDSIDPDKFSAWLFKVAINRYFDMCRRKNRQVHLSIDSITLPASECGPELSYIRQETREEIQSTLGGLSDLSKRLLILKYDLHLSYKEIGVMLELKPETVKTYLYRARKQFEAHYRRENDHDG
ncbi:sigma-70 family RNA polymerase sigma factor [Paenibacillus sp. N4]|uniref:RNA polymerase sigma factor n=1 Tax=Paenibacillus vietnamensis TaxID=2590547 RepID=UPI001CD088C6|nr:sigma-70 family RNA polymerase sigma factor [Paenibacillus vietnamensis]MCA0756238.1 sigma-70 family RNA polymerase sigma factor [Paenibacillus vietnamensis]